MPNVEWYVIGYHPADGDNAGIPTTAGAVTLLPKQDFGTNKRFNNAQSAGNDYTGSEIQEYVEGLTANEQPLDAIAYALAEINVANPDITGAVPYLLSSEEVNSISVAAFKNAILNLSQWWLRSKPANNTHADFAGSGGFGTRGVDGTACVRPAIQLDLSKVAFSAKDNKFLVQVISANDVEATYGDTDKPLREHSAIQPLGGNRAQLRERRSPVILFGAGEQNLGELFGKALIAVGRVDPTTVAADQRNVDVQQRGELRVGKLQNRHGAIQLFPKALPPQHLRPLASRRHGARRRNVLCLEKPRDQRGDQSLPRAFRSAAQLAQHAQQRLIVRVAIHTLGKRGNGPAAGLRHAVAAFKLGDIAGRAAGVTRDVGVVALQQREQRLDAVGQHGQSPPFFLNTV